MNTSPLLWSIPAARPLMSQSREGGEIRVIVSKDSILPVVSDDTTGNTDSSIDFRRNRQFSSSNSSLSLISSAAETVSNFFHLADEYNLRNAAHWTPLARGSTIEPMFSFASWTFRNQTRNLYYTRIKFANF